MSALAHPFLADVHWKSTGENHPPVGIAPAHIRPLTNKDPGNVFPAPFGRPRPIKHYRRGRGFGGITAVSLLGDNATPQELAAAQQLDYNLHRLVLSSGHRGSTVQIAMDTPGSVAIVPHVRIAAANDDADQADCNLCQGAKVMANYQPNTTNVTETPNADTCNARWCCNAEKKARTRSRAASTLIKKNYAATAAQLMQQRCMTYQQKQFQYESSLAIDGGDHSAPHTFLANCNPGVSGFATRTQTLIDTLLSRMTTAGVLDTEAAAAVRDSDAYTSLQAFGAFVRELEDPTATAIFEEFLSNPYTGLPREGVSDRNASCKLTVYDPNNKQFATQGAVSASTRTSALKVNTVRTSAKFLHEPPPSALLDTGNNTPLYLLKNKGAAIGTNLPPGSSYVANRRVNQARCMLDTPLNKKYHIYT